MQARPAGATATVLRTVVGSTALAVAVLAALVALDLDARVREGLAWIEAQGPVGAAAFVAVMALAVLLLLPGVLLTTGAGFVFGVFEGSVYVVLGTTLGATGSFLVARYLLGPRAAAFVLRHARLRAVDAALSARGLRVVLLTRLVPFFPFKVSNYVLGLSRVPLRDFVAGTALGIVPLSVNSVYLGAVAADLATLGTRHRDWSGLQWTLYGVGLAVAIGAVAYVGRIAARALAEAEERPDEDRGHI